MTGQGDSALARPEGGPSACHDTLTKTHFIQDHSNHQLADQLAEGADAGV
jgi:hypothetical protein